MVARKTNYGSKSKDGPRDRQFVAALARGLSVLRCFSGQEREFSPSEIAKLTGLLQPTTWRLCQTLLDLGFLTRVKGSEKLRVGLKAAGVGRSLLSNLPILEKLRPWMRELEQEFKGAISLAGRHDLEMIFIERYQGSSFVTDARVGMSVPVSQSTLGWAYLAGLATPERTRLVDAIKAAEPEMWRVAKPKFTKAYDSYRERGFVFSIGALHPMINAAAVPLLVPEHDEVLALSCGGLASNFTGAKLAAVGSILVKIRKRVEAQQPRSEKSMAPVGQVGRKNSRGNSIAR